jgi:hypothetical protein
LYRGTRRVTEPLTPRERKNILQADFDATNILIRASFENKFIYGGRVMLLEQFNDRKISI